MTTVNDAMPAPGVRCGDIVGPIVNKHCDAGLQFEAPLRFDVDTLVRLHHACQIGWQRSSLSR
jgi:hypothetical protein